MLMTIALDREQGPDGGKPREIKREKVKEMMTQEQKGAKSHECLVFPVVGEPFMSQNTATTFSQLSHSRCRPSNYSVPSERPHRDKGLEQAVI